MVEITKGALLQLGAAFNPRTGTAALQQYRADQRAAAAAVAAEKSAQTKREADDNRADLNRQSQVKQALITALGGLLKDKDAQALFTEDERNKLLQHGAGLGMFPEGMTMSGELPPEAGDDVNPFKNQGEMLRYLNDNYNSYRFGNLSPAEMATFENVHASAFAARDIAQRDPTTNEVRVVTIRPLIPDGLKIGSQLEQQQSGAALEVGDGDASAAGNASATETTTMADGRVTVQEQTGPSAISVKNAEATISAFGDAFGYSQDLVKFAADNPGAFGLVGGAKNFLGGLAEQVDDFLGTDVITPDTSRDDLRVHITTLRGKLREFADKGNLNQSEQKTLDALARGLDAADSQEAVIASQRQLQKALVKILRDRGETLRKAGKNPRVQIGRRRSTGENVISYDGGKTWQALEK